MRKCCGLDAYIYLKFMHHNAIFFLVIATISCCSLLPTYLLGETNKERLTGASDKFTLLNALGHTQKMWIVFIITFVVGICGHIFIYIYEQNIEADRVMHEQRNKKHVSEFTIRKHTVHISGINKELPAEQARNKLKEFYSIVLRNEKLLPQCIAEKNLLDQIVPRQEDTLCVEMINDMNVLMQLKDKIERNGLKNEFYKEKFLNEAEVESNAPGAVDGLYCRKVKEAKGCLCCKKRGYEVIQQHYYLRKRTILQMKLEKEIEMQTKRNFGMSVIINDSEKVTQEFIESFKKVRKILNDHHEANVEQERKIAREERKADRIKKREEKEKAEKARKEQKQEEEFKALNTVISNKGSDDEDDNF